VSTNLVRYATDDGGVRWGVVKGETVVPLPAEYVGTADVLADGVKLAHSLLGDAGAERLPLADLPLLHPAPAARIFCQGANYRSHMLESGMDPNRAFNMLFTKSTASLSGPDDDIVRPAHVKLLDYEVELGIVLGKTVTGPVTVTEDDLPDYVGGFVVANDVSARDVQLPQGQWYKGKSYPTFCPVGPYLCVPDRDEVGRWRDLRLTLSVNGTIRQDGLAGDMVFGPAATLTELSTLERLDVGDLLLTGTPGGVALQPPRAAVQRIAGLLPEARRWELFVKGQARSSAYLRPGDRVAASIRTADGALDLGTQHTTLR
jgi:2-keto-4-pentenoate hydratase/2-oxohepta-3-ene-1,7-dioic acid hydratase in catechol pathway